MSNRPSPPTPAVATREGGHVVEMQRRRLMFAIVEVLGENGLEGATIARVCERAGVSRRTFYELFEDREGCLLAALDLQVERLAEHARVELESESRWRERVGRSLTALLEQLDAQPDAARFLLIETPRAGAPLLERRRELLEALAELVDRGRREARAGNEPPPLTAQGVVGGALSVIHARLLEQHAPDAPGGPLVELVGPLMAMIVHPYLGAAAARKELERPVPRIPQVPPSAGADPFKDLPIRFTYRTARVLATIAEDPGASNRHIATCSGIADDGQVSRLLARLSRCELIENRGQGHAKGEPNAWTLTQRGHTIHATISHHSARPV
jgi:AcrR family transcriptional regulator